MKKLYVDWQKLINWDKYNDVEILLIYQWLVKTGWKCAEYVSPWNYEGLHKTFHGYSHNNCTLTTYYNLGAEKNINPYMQNWEDILKLGFYKILCNTNLHEFVKDFLRSENIMIGKKRYIEINDDFKNNGYFERSCNWNSFNIYWLLYYFSTRYKDKEINLKVDWDSGYAYIKNNICWGTNGDKWRVWFGYTFHSAEGSCWDWNLYQNNGENICDFFNRAMEEIDKLIINGVI